MIDIKYEHHLMPNPDLPFIFHTDICIHNTSGTANWHENIEFLYCVHGEGNVTCDTANIHMNKGDTVIINARQLHAVSSDSDVKYHCLIIDKSFFKDNGIDVEDLTFKQHICDIKTGAYVERISEFFTFDKSLFSVAETRLAVLDFIVYICKNFSVQSKNESKKISKSHAAVLDAVEFINTNFTQKLTLEELSAKAGFSKYHFTRIFKENTGFTVIEHINAIRCENARHLLRETQKPISEICFECGFDSPSYFAKAFSKLFGLLPSEYRKKHSRH